MITAVRFDGKSGKTIPPPLRLERKCPKEQSPAMANVRVRNLYMAGGSRENEKGAERYPHNLVERAENEGFEPSKGCPLHAFQACALGRYANSPVQAVGAITTAFDQRVVAYRLLKL